MRNDGVAFLKEKHRTHTVSLRETGIAQYHELLLRDKTLVPRVFENSTMRCGQNRLVYGDRPIGVALRPHVLKRRQFEMLKQVAELIVRALECLLAVIAKELTMMRFQAIGGTLRQR